MKANLSEQTRAMVKGYHDAYEHSIRDNIYEESSVLWHYYNIGYGAGINANHEEFDVEEE